MRDILIILLAVLFTMMTIVLFEIKSMTQQFLTLIIVLLGFIVFYMAIDKVHIFKEAGNEVNINNTSFTEEGEMEEALGEDLDLGEDVDMGLGVDPEQNLVEADHDEPVVQEIIEVSNPPLIVQETIENLNYTVNNVDTHNFGIVNRKINATKNN